MHVQAVFTAMARIAWIVLNYVKRAVVPYPALCVMQATTWNKEDAW